MFLLLFEQLLIEVEENSDVTELRVFRNVDEISSIIDHRVCRVQTLDSVRISIECFSLGRIGKNHWSAGIKNTICWKALRNGNTTDEILFFTLELIIESKYYSLLSSITIFT